MQPLRKKFFEYLQLCVMIMLYDYAANSRPKGGSTKGCALPFPAAAILPRRDGATRTTLGY
jgi:hypothetical protein